MNHRRQVWRDLAEVILRTARSRTSASAAYFYIYAAYAGDGSPPPSRPRPSGREPRELLSEIARSRGAVDARMVDRPLEHREDDDYERAFARAKWDDAFGGEVGVHLDPSIPCADLGRCGASPGGEEARRQAHRSFRGPRPSEGPRLGAPEETLTLGEVDDAIDVIGEIFTRYSSLFTAAAMGVPGACDPARLARAVPRALDPTGLGSGSRAANATPGVPPLRSGVLPSEGARVIGREASHGVVAPLRWSRRCASSSSSSSGSLVLGAPSPRGARSISQTSFIAWTEPARAALAATTRSSARSIGA